MGRGRAVRERVLGKSFFEISFFRLRKRFLADISLHLAAIANKEFGCSGGVSRIRSIAPLSDWEGRQRGAFFK